MKKTISLLLSFIMLVIPLCSGIATYAVDTGVTIKNFRLEKDKHNKYNLKWDTVGKAPSDVDYEEFYTQWSVNGSKFKNCNNKDLKIIPGVKYKFRVRHYTSRYNPDTLDTEEKYSSWVECSYSSAKETPKFTFTSTKNGFNYSIKTKYNYDKYEIYKYNKKAKKYKLFKTVSLNGGGPLGNGNSIKTNTSASYKVRGKSTLDGKTYYTNFSNKISARNSYTSKVTLKSVKSSKVGKVTTKWNKCTKKGCSGYQIQYTTDTSLSNGGETVKVKNVKTLSKTLNFVEGLTYKVRVRPYFTKTGGTVYGAWSKTKNICVKSGIGGTVNAKKLINKQKLKKTNAKDERLDKILNKILAKYTNKNMSTYEKLFACYKYVSNEKFSNYGIKGKNNARNYENYALYVLDNKEGSCETYNALFALLAKKIGIKDVRLAGGSVSDGKGGFTGHTWCVIKMNGHFYLFDPRLEMYQIKKGGSKNGKTYFCVPISDKNKTAQQYRYGMSSTINDLGDKYDFYNPAR